MSRMIDCNCLVGGWPFHMVRRKTLADLKALHKKFGLSGGYVSSTEAIFYNDPFEADLALAQELDGKDYRLVLTVNPLLPATLENIRRGARELGAVGVRILPGFHGYTLDNAHVKAMCQVLREEKLGLWLTPRMEDERITYMFHPKSVPFDSVIKFLQEEQGFPVLLANARLGEVLAAKDVLAQRPDVFADCSGLKDTLFPVDALHKAGVAPAHLVYGSLSPLFVLSSTLMLVEKAEIPEADRARVLAGEAFTTLLR